MGNYKQLLLEARDYQIELDELLVIMGLKKRKGRKYMELPKVKSKKSLDLREYKFLIYGDPGAGKSTLASQFPDAVFIATEPGLKFLEVYGGEKQHRTWSDIKDTVKRLCSEEHDFKTVVFDTVDNAFEFCALETLKKRGIEHESDEGYGKGWGLIKREFTSVVNYLANSGFGIVFISHEKQMEREDHGVKRFYIDNSLSNSAKNYINGLVDFIFYCSMNDKGERLMRTKASLNVNAKDRSGVLPEIMPMDFKQLGDTLSQREQKQTNKQGKGA